MSKVPLAPNVAIRAADLERSRRRAEQAREKGDRHQYFRNIAEARFVLRKIARLIEEEARPSGVDALARQALIQIYGSPGSALQVKDIAHRLDITPAFASSLVKELVKKKYAVRKYSEDDRRATWVEVTDAGKQMLYVIDDNVQININYFNHHLTIEQRQSALAILMFYVGVSLAE
jgi:DNA-binding MarR family transcriptional regulator